MVGGCAAALKSNFLDGRNATWTVAAE